MVDQTNMPRREQTDVLGERIGAQIIDLVIMFVVNTIISMGFLILGLSANAASGGNLSSGGSTLMTGAMGIGAIIGLFIIFAYNFLLEAFWNGQTLGKKALGIKVVQEDGSQVSKLGAFIRNIPGFVSVISYITWLTHLIGLISIAASDKRQRLFDHLASTLVVEEDWNTQ
jgi:uncharacterized RDD family membrane protein YckC